MRRRKKLDKSIFLLIFIVLILAGAGIFLYFKFRTDQITDAIRQEKEITTAFLITDGDKLLFTEILFYNSKTGKGAVLDIPDNTGMIIESLKKIDSIDVLYSPGKENQYIKKIEELTAQKIPYFIRIDVSNLVKLVDLLDGLEMFIANPVEIKNEDQMVLLPSGSMLLDGSKIKTFITFKLDDAEAGIESINRRHKFMQAFLKRIGEKNSGFEQEKVMSYVHEFIDTNLDKPALTAYLKEMKNLDVERLVFQRVLGVERVVDDKSLLFPHYDGKLLKETVTQTLESLANVEVTGNSDLVITVSILNGTDKNGLASRTAALFRSFGYDVIDVGNADRFDYDQTEVIDRSGDINKAQKAASLIDCKQIDTEVEKQNAEVAETVADVTIILGNDFDGRYCKD